MQLNWLFYASGYLVSVFLLSALAVRLWPKSWLAKLIRRRFALFAIVPLLIVYRLVTQLFDALSVGTEIPRMAFERLSGQKLYSKRRGYGAQAGGRRRGSKKGDKSPARAD